MSPPTDLCEWCDKIFFDPETLYYLFWETREITHYSLGPGSRVQNSSCPFCLLVAQTFYGGHKTLAEIEDVEVSWQETVPGRRAFQVWGSRDDTYIAFATESAPGDASRRPSAPRGTRLSYYVEGTTKPMIDIHRILSWISSCDELHRDKCSPPATLSFHNAYPRLPIMRFIDVNANCIVETTSLSQYIALSYVWGAVPSIRLTKANRSPLLKPGSLEKLIDLVPWTIRDAIVLVRNLGCRYLWVDALCLVQNDEEDLIRGVNAMDLIYERAWLTIVASCGYNANFRLPGVQEGTRKACTNTVEVTPGTKLGVITELDELLIGTIYETRAWTFQERLLSHRTLYFVDEQLFYRCRGADQAEHYADIPAQNEEYPAVSATAALSQAILLHNPPADYRHMLFHYSRRLLTNQNDAPRAMAGIMRRFAEALCCEFFQGIPVAFFDYFLVFQPFYSFLNRRSTMPSYSWTGWQGSVTFHATSPELYDIGIPTGYLQLEPEYDEEWLDKATWVIWYKRSPSGVTSLVWDPSANTDPAGETSGYRNWSLFNDGGRRVPLGIDPTQTAPSQALWFSREPPPYPMLQFWTMSVFYNITDVDVFNGVADIEDCHGEKCGRVGLDAFEDLEYFDFTRSFQFILLSECWAPKSVIEETLAEEQDEDDNNAPEEDLKYYNALLIEWQGGIAERRGFAVILQDAVETSLPPGPEWKEILLA
ncbi:hypothetical protein Neosp_014678 [[Neocosmospora] mangrovei]